MRRVLVALVVLLIPASLRADPVTIVNTGPGPSGFPMMGLGGLQWLAVEFDVSRPDVITGVEGWMLISRGGFLDLVLYTDGGEIPGTELSRQTVRLESAAAASWRGVSSGLTWLVAPGTYWVGFEMPLRDVIQAGLPFPSERPLTNGAIVDTENEGWYHEADGAARIGLRIFGAGEEPPTPTPEPGSMLLFASGLAALAARRHRRR